MIFSLLFILNLSNYSLAYPNENALNPTLHEIDAEPHSNDNLINDNRHQLESRVGIDEPVDENEGNENDLYRLNNLPHLHRSKRAVWFGTIRTPDINLPTIRLPNIFGSNRLFNNGYSYGYGYSRNRYSTTTRYTNSRIVQPGHSATYTNTIVQPSHSGTNTNVNYQPVNNYVSNNRINNAPATYYVPSTSPASRFVEASNFVTPPNRDAPAVLSSPAPVEHSNEDWIGSSDD